MKNRTLKLAGSYMIFIALIKFWYDVIMWIYQWLN